MADLLPLQADDPESLGHYRLLGRIGSGGQGVVYLGQGDGPVPRVAIKLLHARLIGDAAARLRFVRELAVAQRVAGFCTAQILEADVAGDRPYIVSEFVPGPSLQELVREAGPRTGADLDRLAIGTVTALAAIHRAGIVHRDFKPPNVLMAPDGPRVIDFGIARALDTFTSLTSQLIGTPAYMAPEQLSDDKAGPAADLFTWGSTMLFAATGRSPFEGPSIPVVAYRVLNFTPDLSALPDRLAGQVAACLAKDPAQRPQAEEVLLRLLGAGADHGFAAEPLPGDGPGQAAATTTPDHHPPTKLITPDANALPETPVQPEATPAIPTPDPNPQEPAVRPAAPAARGQPPAQPSPTAAPQGTAPAPGPVPPPGPPPQWPGRPQVRAPGGAPETLGRRGPMPARAPQPGASAATPWLPNAAPGTTLLKPLPDEERLRRTPALLTGLALAFLCGLFDVAAFVFMAVPAGAAAPDRVLVTGGFALLGLVTIVAVAFALRGGQAATWTVLGTRLVKTLLWVAWSLLSQTTLLDEAVVNLGAPALVALLLGYALWRAGSRPAPPGAPFEPPTW